MIIAEQDLGTPVGGTYPEFRYPCPACGSRDNLAVNVEKGTGHCFGCDLRVFVKKIEDYTRPYELIDLDDLFKEEEVEGQVIIPNHIWEHITRPLSLEGLEYLHRRGFTGDEISYYGIREGSVLYHGRVIIPTYNAQGQITFFVARDYTGTAEKKYLNPPKQLCRAGDNIWGLNNARSSPAIIICEGVFSAMAVNHYLNSQKAVAVFGKVLKDNQVSELLATRASVFWLCLDADADLSTRQWADALSRSGRVVKLCKTPSIYGEHADVCDMTREQFLRNLSAATDYDPLQLVISELEASR